VNASTNHNSQSGYELGNTISEKVIPPAITGEQWLAEPVGKLLSSCGCKLGIDIGANHGTWTTWMAKYFKKVIAVEPDSRCSEIDGVEFHRILIGDCSGVKRLWLSEMPEQNHTSELHPLHQSSGQPIDINQKTLDELCDGRVPDFVKIDVEGAEDLILKGIKDLSIYAKTAFLIESHNRTAQLSEYFKQHKRLFSIIEHPFRCPNHCWFAIEASPREW